MTKREGMLVRFLVGVREDRDYAVFPATPPADDVKDRLRDILGRDVQFRWIEADVTPWQPPAEETVQGREVEG